MTYYQFEPTEGDPFGSFEVFYTGVGECTDLAKIEIAAAVPAEDRITYQPGWYWWACFPGCMPDGDPEGPFQSEDAAVEAANQF
jgi:hypothetical protein